MLCPDSLNTLKIRPEIKVLKLAAELFTSLILRSDSLDSLFCIHNSNHGLRSTDGGPTGKLLSTTDVFDIFSHPGTLLARSCSLVQIANKTNGKQTPHFVSPPQSYAFLPYPGPT